MRKTKIEIRTDATGRYRQPCPCVSRRRLARKRAKHLREEAAAALLDAARSEHDFELADAADFRGLALEFERKAREVMREVRRPLGSCLVCGNTREILGNGTYGGPAHKAITIVQVM